MADLFTLLKKLKGTELALIASLIASAVYGAFWIENRYAKIADTQARLDSQQQELHIVTQDLQQVGNQLIEILYALPPDKRAEIEAKLKSAKNLKPTSGNKIQ